MGGSMSMMPIRVLAAIGLVLLGALALAAGPAKAGETTRTLTVTTSGGGAGWVSSTPAGITSCWTTCAADFPTGTVVRLTANPTLRSGLTRWSGDCSSPSLSCEVTMDSDKSVGAVFESFAPEPFIRISDPVVTPRVIKTKRGHRGKLVVKVRSTGEIPLSGVEICANAPVKALALAHRCRQTDALDMDEQGRVVFRPKVRRKTKPGKKFKIRFTATADNAQPTHATAVIKVKR